VAVSEQNHKMSGMQIDWVSNLAAIKGEVLKTRRIE
jgi:hypothetical protein